MSPAVALRNIEIRPGEFVATWTHARPAATGSA
jgi:hypothetical protein